MSQATALAESQLITGRELFAMGDIGPCELIDGRIVPITPTGAEHARVEFSLGSELVFFVRRHGIGWVLGGEVGIYTGHSPDRIRGADIVFLSKERAPNGPPEGFLDVAPELIVEIIGLPPSDRWQKVRQKINEYFAIGVEHVWVVEPEHRSILVYRSATHIHTLLESDMLAGEGSLEGFSLPVATIFKK